MNIDKPEAIEILPSKFLKPKLPDRFKNRAIRASYDGSTIADTQAVLPEIQRRSLDLSAAGKQSLCIFKYPNPKFNQAIGLDRERELNLYDKKPTGALINTINLDELSNFSQHHLPVKPLLDSVRKRRIERRMKGRNKKLSPQMNRY